MLLGCAQQEQRPRSANDINEACGLEMQAARTAIRLREKNKPKTQLKQQLAPLTADSSRLLFNMHQILDEVYAHPQLNAVIYPVYRFQLCTQQLQNKLLAHNIDRNLTGLLACRAQYNTTSSNESTQCVLDTFNH